MPASGIKLADANVWLALAYGSHAHHQTAAMWFDSLPDSSCAFCRITQLALLRHLTNVKIMGQAVQSQQQAWKAYDCFLNDPRVLFLNEAASLDQEFRAQSQLPAPGHHHWTDAYLASLAMSATAQLVSFDKGMATFAGLDLLLLA